MLSLSVVSDMIGCLVFGSATYDQLGQMTLGVLLWSWNFNIAICFNSCMLKFVDISATTLTLVAGLEIKKYICNAIEKIKDQSKSLFVTEIQKL